MPSNSVSSIHDTLLHHITWIILDPQLVMVSDVFVWVL